MTDYPPIMINGKPALYNAECHNYVLVDMKPAPPPTVGIFERPRHPAQRTTKQTMRRSRVPDLVDRFRHWLIRIISCGDMILLNAERRTDGALAPLNCGPALIANYHFRCIEADWTGVSVGFLYGGKRMLHVSGSVPTRIKDCSFYGGCGDPKMTATIWHIQGPSSIASLIGGSHEARD